MRDQRIDPPDPEMDGDDAAMLHECAAELDSVAEKVSRIFPEHAKDLRSQAAWFIREAGPLP